MQKFLIIQTAFLGDVVLATPLLEKIRANFPAARIDFLLRKGNETLLTGHPQITKLLVWDKSKKKKDMFRVIKEIRKEQYDFVINLQRFGSSGFITWRSGGKEKIGFDKNPFAFCYTPKVKHEIGKNQHEIARNLQLIEHLTDTKSYAPKLYPSDKDASRVKRYKATPYLCLAPASVWFTKQLPQEKWIELIRQTAKEQAIYLLGSPTDKALCEAIKNAASRKNVTVLAGELTLLESCALMKCARMNYVNDSAPMHLCSAVNAPVTAFYCSTVPSFGFGPLSDNSSIVETKEVLDCRPCGLHGSKECPKGHFKCGKGIDITSLNMPQ